MASNDAERPPGGRGRRPWVAVLGVLGLVAGAGAALPALRGADGGRASAATTVVHLADAGPAPSASRRPASHGTPRATAGRPQRTTDPGRTAQPAGTSPAPPAAGTTPPGAPAAGRYVTLAQPVLPLPAPDGEPPRAQYREMHANCAVTKRADDDPIVFPGLPGAAHNHTFVGNSAVNASSTPESLVRTGVSTCEDKKDTASYWFPTLLRGGEPVEVSTVTFYYKSGVRDHRTVRPFPPGFRLLVGDMRTPDAASFGGYWSCGGGTSQDIPAGCARGNTLVVRYQAPSCWDGVHLDTPDHKSHMAYPVDGLCPADHPVAVPMLQSKITYRLSGGGTAGLAYSSGPSYSFHYDFMNGWDQARLTELVEHCINGGRQCNGYGVDRHKP